MNPLLDALLKNGTLLDIAGITGLGLIAAAAVKLALKERSWGGTMMAVGAVALVTARSYHVLYPHVVTNDVLYAIGPIGISLMIGLPPLLLTLGLAGVVMGLWSHERWLQEEGR